MRDKSHQRPEKRNSRVLSRDTYDSIGRNVRVEWEVGGVSGRFPVSESAYDAYGDLIASSVFTNGTDVVTEDVGPDVRTGGRASAGAEFRRAP